MTVTVLVNGARFTGWKEVEVKQSFDEIAGEGNLTISELPGQPLPMRIGDHIVIVFGSRPVLTGYIHEVSGSLDCDNHDITVTCRDQTQDFVDSTVGPDLKLKAPITPQQLVQRTVGAMGLSIPVKDEVGEKPFEQGEQISAAIDQKGFEFCDQWLQKRQCLMTTDGKGSIVITRNRQRRGGGMLYSNFENDPKNNVKRSTYRVSDLNRHNCLSINGQKSTNDKDWWESKEKGEQTAQASPLQKNWGMAFDTSVRPQRKLHARGSKGLSGGTPGRAARWRSNEAKARGFQYTATVTNFNGAAGWLWWPGYIVPVFDAHWQIAADLFISAVCFKKSLDGGELVEITCTYPDAYSLATGGEAAATERTADMGMGSTPTGTYQGTPNIAGYGAPPGLPTTGGPR